MRVVSRWNGLTILKQVVWMAGVLSSGSVFTQVLLWELKHHR